MKPGPAAADRPTSLRSQPRPRHPRLPQFLPRFLPVLRALRARTPLDPLHPRHGLLPPPLRAALYGQEAFRVHALGLARAQPVERRRGRRAHRPPRFLPRLDDNFALLQHLAAAWRARAASGRRLPPAAERLLEQMHRLDAQPLQVREALPAAVHAELPIVRAEPLAGLPRAYGIAWAFVAHTDSQFDEALLSGFVTAYQEADALTLAELRALPALLRVVLVENLARLAEHVDTRLAARDAARQALAAAEPGLPARLDAAWQRTLARGPGIEAAFVGALAAALRERPEGDATAEQARLWVAARVPEPAQALATLQALEAADDVSTGHALDALQALDRFDDARWAASQSRLLQALMRSPAFAADDPATQLQAAQAAERLAHRLRRPALDVAQAALARAEADDDSPLAALLGDTTEALCADLGVAPAALPWWRRLSWRARWRLYAAALLLGTLGLVQALLGRGQLANWAEFVSVLLLLVPASECALALVHAVLARAAPRTPLPRLALPDGVAAPAHRTLVVLPALLDDSARIAALAQQLDSHALANPDPQLQFALLAELPARGAEAQALLLQAASDAIEALNLRHPASDALPAGQQAAPRFLLLLHHAAAPSGEAAGRVPAQALHALLAALRGTPMPDTAETEAHPLAPAFADLGAQGRVPAGVRYLLVLRADSVLPPGSVGRLVAVAAHPLHRPRLQRCGLEGALRVVRGHALLQPRLAVPPAAPDDATVYARWLGQAEADDDAMDDALQAVFGEARFCGVGLIDIEAAHAVLAAPAARLQGRGPGPDFGQWEALWARSGWVHDVELPHPPPADPWRAGAARRRRVAAQWQLLPLLPATLHGGSGPLNVWQLVDRLRCTLLPPTALALLGWAVATQVLNPAATLLLVLGALGLEPVLNALQPLALWRPGLSGRHALRESARRTAGAAALLGWRLLTLPQRALWQLQGVADALRLLADAYVPARPSPRPSQGPSPLRAAPRAADAGALSPAFWRRHGAASALAALWMLGAALGPAPSAGWLLALGLPWLATPLWLALAARPAPRGPGGREPTAEERDELLALARHSWRYFERAIAADGPALPPTLLRLQPSPRPQRHAAPADAALYMGAAVCARQLGLIGTEELVQRLGATLQALRRLPRHRGHWPQRIDLDTLRAVAPQRIDTADSGTVAALLWMVAQACREAPLAPQRDAEARRALELALAQVRTPALRPLLQAPPLQALLAGTDLWTALRNDTAALRLRWQAAHVHWQEACADAQAAHGRDSAELLALGDLLNQLDSLLRDREADRDRWPGALRALAQQCEQLVQDMDFSLLRPADGRGLHAGYRLDEAMLEPRRLALLGGAARLASLVAIAKGDAPPSHWGALRRAFVAAAGGAALRSPSGGLHEALLPALLLDERPGSLLGRSARTAWRAHLLQARHDGLPWGAAASLRPGGAETDAAVQPFGLATLAQPSGSAGHRVVAPWASLLALPLGVRTALANLAHLRRLGAGSAFGLVDAVGVVGATGPVGAISAIGPTGSTGQVGPLGSLRQHADGEAAPELRPVPAHRAGPQGWALLALAHVLAQRAPQRWFGAVPRVRAHAALLHERMPATLWFGRTPARAGAGEPAALALDDPGHVLDPAAPPRGLPPTQVLGNGRYTLSLRPHGAGLARWQGMPLQRDDGDALRDGAGSWLMLRCADEVEFHSLTRAPNPRPDARYGARFYDDHAEFEAECADWASHVSVWVAPDDDVECRRVVLHNPADVPLEVELLSFFEAALGPQHDAGALAAVRAHAHDAHCLLLERPAGGGAGEGDAAEGGALWLAHFIAGADGLPLTVRLLADRARLLPRRGHAGTARPGPSQQPGPDGLLDTGLDPVAALAARVVLPPRARCALTLATAVAAEPATLLRLVDQYRQEVHLQRSREMAATLSRLLRRELPLAPADADALQALATLLLQHRSLRRAPPEGSIDRRRLAPLGLSPERPLLLLRLDGDAARPLPDPLLDTLLAAQRRWARAGLAVDLAVLAAAALQPALQAQVRAWQDALAPAAGAAARAGSISVLASGSLDAGTLATLHALARIDLLADGRPLARLVAQALAADALPVPRMSGTARSEAADEIPAPAPYDDRRRRPAVAEAPWPEAAASGSFTADGYELAIDSQRTTPRAWQHRLAHGRLGCSISESGGGHTWAGALPLTRPHHDPLLDPPSEHYLLQDLGSGAIVGLLPTLDRNGLDGYRVLHGPGFSRFRHQRAGLDIEVEIRLHPDEAAKLVQVRLQATDGQPRRLRLLAMAEWALGGAAGSAMTVATEFDPAGQAVLAQQCERADGHGGACALLLQVGARVSQWTCERREFYGDDGQLRLPRRLRCASGLGLDPCGALEAKFTLTGSTPHQVTWALGHASSRAGALALAQRLHAPHALEAAFSADAQRWRQRLSALEVHSADPLFDALVNRWLPYQAWLGAAERDAAGRADLLALAALAPEAAADTAALLLRSARRAGAPTAGSLDAAYTHPLWLALALQRQLQARGDGALLAAAVHDDGTTLYERVARDIDAALPPGAHGLPRLPPVAPEGTGPESVALGQLLLALLRDAPAWAAARGDGARAERWTQARAPLEAALRKHGWDGHWFRHGYRADGRVLGSHLNDEAQLMLAEQAWAVLALGPQDAAAAEALQLVADVLAERGLLPRLAPPLVGPDADLGIGAQAAGVGANGGQHSASVAWAAWAQALLGQAGAAWAAFTAASPAHRSASSAGQRRYQGEPYALPASVATLPPWEGRAGAPWAAGAAGPLWLAAVEGLLGLRLHPGGFSLRPALPAHWPALVLRLRGPRGEVHVTLSRVTWAGDADALPLRAGEFVAFDALPPQARLRLQLPDAPVSAAGALDEAATELADARR